MSSDNTAFLAKYGSAEHVDSIIAKNPRWTTLASLLQDNKSITPKHIDKLLDHKIEDVRALAVAHPNASTENVGKAIKDRDETVRHYAASNKMASADHLSHAMNDHNERVRSSALENPNATSDHVEKGMSDESHYVRFAAAGSRGATKEQLIRIRDNAQNDEYTRSRATGNIDRRS